MTASLLPFDECGSGDDVILWIHGFGSSARNWEQYVRRFPEYRSLAVDLPGFGRAAHLGERSFVPQLAEAVAGTMEHLGIARYFCIGHSLGGGVALRLAITRPDAVRGMFGIAALPAHGMPVDEDGLALLEAFAASYGKEDVVRSALSAQAPNADPAYLEVFVQDMLRCNERSFKDFLTNRDSYAWSQEEDLPGITVPTCHLVPGADVAVSPEEQLRTALAIPSGRIVVINDAGHFYPGEDPDQLVAEIRNFLDWVVARERTHGLVPAGDRT